MGWFDGTPGQDGSTDFLGGLLHYKPVQGQTGGNRLSLLGSALADSAAQLSGHPDRAMHLANSEDQIGGQINAAKRDAINKQIQSAYANGDLEAVRAALMQADPADIAHITGALNFGQPKYQEAGGGLYSIPTIGDGKPQQVVAPKAAAPTTRTRNEGQNQITEQWDPQTTTWTRVGIAPRFKPTVAKPDATYVPPWQR